MNPTRKQKVGSFGEQIAAEYLVRHGYQIIEKNARCSRFEIDLIAKLNQRMVIVEVRTRTNLVLGQASEAFNTQKMKVFRKAIAMFIKERRLDENFVSADLIAVDLNKNTRVAKIRHFSNIL